MAIKTVREVHRVSDSGLEQTMALIEKSQQLADHFPDEGSFGSCPPSVGGEDYRGRGLRGVGCEVFAGMSETTSSPRRQREWTPVLSY